MYINVYGLAIAIKAPFSLCVSFSTKEKTKEKVVQSNTEQILK